MSLLHTYVPDRTRPSECLVCTYPEDNSSYHHPTEDMLALRLGRAIRDEKNPLLALALHDYMDCTSELWSDGHDAIGGHREDAHGIRASLLRSIEGTE
jgi:hypothetical protein